MAAARRDGEVARRRFVAVLVLLALVGAIAIAVILATADSGGGVRLHRVVANDGQQAVQQLQQLIDDNTK